MITPSRSTKTALVTPDFLAKRVDHEVVEKNVHAFDHGCPEFVYEDRDRNAVIGHLSHRATVEPTESDHLCA